MRYLAISTNDLVSEEERILSPFVSSFLIASTCILATSLTSTIANFRQPTVGYHFIDISYTELFGKDSGNYIVKSITPIIGRIIQNRIIVNWFGGHKTYDNNNDAKFTLTYTISGMIEEDNLIPFIKSYKMYNEPYNQARQIFPDAYIHNGCIDIIKTNIIINNNILSGNKILPYIMQDNNDIDDINDFIISENN